MSEPMQHKSVASHEAMEALWDLQSELNDLAYHMVKVTCRNRGGPLIDGRLFIESEDVEQAGKQIFAALRSLLIR